MTGSTDPAGAAAHLLPSAENEKPAEVVLHGLKTIAATHLSRHFNSTVQYAVSRNCFQLEYFASARRMLITGLRFGFTGLVIRCMCACSGVRPPFFTLQRTQQQTMFSQLLRPPWLRGSTWSSDSSLVAYFFPQYWQRFPSRA